ncbi:MAG: aminotransferase class V-fold PLP-dependent enzyme [Candidatus Latescibacterota bacterium]|jgi:isopenicillin-N epimerase
MTQNTHEHTSDLRSLFLLRPEVIFFNHGSFGACPRAVFEEYQRWQLELEHQPVEFIQHRLNDLLEQARQRLGTFLNAEAEDVVFVTNVSMGLNIVARSLDLKPGDEVLSTDHEYGTLDRTWELVCERRGAHYIRRPIPFPITSSEEIVDAVWSGVTERTRVLYCSHITSPTALILPVEELVRRARDAGITTIIDGAHAAGQIPLDLSALGADFYSANCHKWMMAPKGVGCLHARKEVHDQLDPLVGGKAKELGTASRLISEHQYQGTRDPAAFISIPACIRFMEEHDWPQVRERCHQLARYAREKVSELTGIPPVMPDSPQFFAQMAILPIPPCDGKVLKGRLLAEYGIEMPTTGHDGQQFLRISVQGYNSQAEIDTLVEALSVLLPEVATP